MIKYLSLSLLPLYTFHRLCLFHSRPTLPLHPFSRNPPIPFLSFSPYFFHLPLLPSHPPPYTFLYPLSSPFTSALLFPLPTYLNSL